MSDDKKKEITFGRKELAPEQGADYRARIASATGKGVNALKGSQPVGGVERPNIPLIQNSPLNPGHNPHAAGGVQPRPAGAPAVRQETQERIAEALAAGKKMEEKELEEGVKKELEEKKKSDEDLFEMFDFQAKSEAERILNNKQRRVAIEERCEELSFEDLLYKDEVRQRVPVVPGKFEPCFRSVTGKETLALKKYIFRETGVSDSYLMEKYNLCLLTMALVDINGREFPDHLDGKGEFDEKSLESKVKVVLEKSSYVIADLGVNYHWFDLRVRRLFNPDSLKNG